MLHSNEHSRNKMQAQIKQRRMLAQSIPMLMVACLAMMMGDRALSFVISQSASVCSGNTDFASALGAAARLLLEDPEGTVSVEEAAEVETAADEEAGALAEATELEEEDARDDCEETEGTGVLLSNFGASVAMLGNDSIRNG
jgi:hypothetical protein